MADVKLENIPTVTTMAVGDKVPFTSAPGTTPVSKNITKENFFKHLALGSDADGDMYYRASGLLARLAKGAANLKLFMKAGATAPEWASGIFVGTLTRDMTAASGDVPCADVGFKPTAIIAIACVANTTGFSIGFQYSTTKYCQLDASYAGTGANNWSGVARLIYLAPKALGTDYQDAIVKTFDAEGFTLTWTKTGTPDAGNATIYYLAIR